MLRALLLPSANRDRALRNYAAYALVAVAMLVCMLIIKALPEQANGFPPAIIFTPASVGWHLLLGLVGIVLLNHTRLPGLWDRTQSVAEKVIVPLLSGLLLGSVAVLVDLPFDLSGELARARGVASIHAPVPLALPLYWGGAFLISIEYFLFFIPLFVWLMSTWLLKGRYANESFWLIGSVTALIEPIGQGRIESLSTFGTPALLSLLIGLALPFAQVWFFGRSGFIACAMMRVGYYSIWHILYGLLGG